MDKQGEEVRTAVREHYAEAARAVDASCCGPTGTTTGLIGRTLYGDEDAEVLPDAALAASLGCGNPTLLAELHPGEVVLDLGSGGGIDVLLSARRVAPSGKAYGLGHDARDVGSCSEKPGRGRCGQRRVPSGHYRVCPIARRVGGRDHLQLRREPVTRTRPPSFREAFRVLKPGGRLAISDIVLRRSLPEPVQQAMGLWTGCVAGALLETDYREHLEEAGLEEVDIEPTHVYDSSDLAPHRW